MMQFDQSHLDNISAGITLFNIQKYWECHEELEHYWLEERGPIRNIYWAIIQVAAAMIHYRESNLEGAIGLIQKAQKKFYICEELRLENIFLEQQLSWKKLKKLVYEVPEKPELEDFKKIYDFRFKDII
jgi:hypothetical protein